MAVNESCIPLTAPHEAAVVITANREVEAMPKRVSLLSMLPPGASSPAMLVSWLAPAVVRSGLPSCSATVVMATPTKKSTLMAEKIAQPCFVFPTILPKV